MNPCAIPEILEEKQLPTSAFYSNLIFLFPQFQGAYWYASILEMNASPIWANT